MTGRFAGERVVVVGAGVAGVAVAEVMVAEGAGFGLLGVRERAARLGGSVDVVSEPGHGTTVRVAVPG